MLCIFDSRFSSNHILKPFLLITAIDSCIRLDETKESQSARGWLSFFLSFEKEQKKA